MNRVRDLRKARGWRQADLAQRLNTNQQTVGRYESELRGLDVETIHKLCDIFDVTADYLLCRSDLQNQAMSEDEAELLSAFRMADDRAREIVRLTLAPFIEEDTGVASEK